MRRIFTLIFCFFLLGFSYGQTTLLNDDFEDGNLVGWTESTVGHWIASTTTPINGTYSAKHNLSFVAGSSWLSHPLAANPTAGDMVWEFQLINGAWDPSSTNRYWFYLMSDQQNIGTGTANGYAVGVNMNFANDLITLYRVTGGAHSADLITSGGAYNWDASEIFGIRITRSAVGLWEMWIDIDGGFDNLVSAGTFSDVTHTTANPYTGLYFDYTSSRAGQLWMDDVKVTTTEGTIPTISLSLERDTVRECGNIQLTVNSTTPVPANKTFALSYNGTASSGIDFSTLPATITILSGNNSASISIATTCDSLFEDTESLNLLIDRNGQSNVVMGDTTGTLAILDYVRVMHYNLLYYPSASNFTTKNADLRIILDHIQPDILGVNEMDAASGSINADSILEKCFNINGINHYQRAAYQNTTGSPIANMLFYNSWKFTLYSQQEISVPGERNPNQYRLYYNYPDLPATNDTIFLDVIQVHLKAGNTPADSLRRIIVSDSIMSWTSRNDPPNLLLMGDFNVYTSTEQAYQTLLNYTPNPVVSFQDPINTPGAWNNNGVFAAVHTQSTRSTSLPDGGAPGGMDDRFDFILSSDNILNGTDSITYIPGTYDAVGQDGIRFNSSLISPANTAVPLTVATALYNFSDHLPVVTGLDIDIPPPISLPVVWDEFNVAEVDEYASLDWKISGIQVDHFDILKSTDGVQFRSIDQLSVSNLHKQPGSFSYIDQEKLQPKERTWYQLVVISQDGERAPSSIKSVIHVPEGEILLTMYPNPASDQVNFALEGFEEVNYSLDIFSMDGRQLISHSGKSGRHFSVSTSQLENGVYFLKGNINNAVITRKLVIRR